jgi:hypothetical protein
MVHLKTPALFGAILALFTAAPALAAITNGDFENGLSGWTPSSGPEIVTNPGAAYTANGTPAQLANNFAAFGVANLANVSDLHQQITLTAGTNYVLSYDFGALGQLGLGQTLTARVFDGEVLLATLDSTAFVTNDLGATFKRYSLGFTAGNGPTNLFFNVDPATINIDGVLDNVTVTTAAVPEPESWILMLAGFGLVGGMARRRAAMASASA